MIQEKFVELKFDDGGYPIPQIQKTYRIGDGGNYYVPQILKAEPTQINQQTVPVIPQINPNPGATPPKTGNLVNRLPPGPAKDMLLNLNKMQSTLDTYKILKSQEILEINPNLKIQEEPKSESNDNTYLKWGLIAAGAILLIYIIK